MTDRTHSERITFHDANETMEVDFSSMTFADVAEVDAIYDEIDRRLTATGQRWFFLVLYTDCVIAPEAWDRFAARGKSANVNHGRGSVRVDAKEETREAIRERAGKESFRSNIYNTRDQALLALGEMRKRQRDLAKGADEVFLRVDNVSLRFGGVKAITEISFEIKRGEISAIIGPNGAGKSSMLNVINGVYHPQEGTITYLGEVRQQMSPRAAACQGIARTFQNIALFKGMSVLDNILTGRNLRMKSSLLAQAIRIGPALREEIAHREVVERISDFLEIQAVR